MSISIFFSYSHEDEALRDKVAKHLSALKRSNVIQEWHDRLIPAGSEWKDEIDRNLRTADIILLLVSASFLSSDYCWSEELAIAMARHEKNEACVIPIILRPCDWQETPFVELQVLPKDGKAVTLWSNEDEALTNVAQGIRGTVNQVVEQKQKKELPFEKGIDYAPLRDMLKAGKWQEADRETWRLLCLVMGRRKEDDLRREDIQKLLCTDLRTIDDLWVEYSNGRFGFSVQKEIYLAMGNPLDGKYHRGTFERFCARVGWQLRRTWVSYFDVIDLCSPKGHLPTIGSGGKYWVEILFSRAESCEL